MSTLTTTRPFVRLVERHALSHRRTWLLPVSGLLEPILFLLSIGLGVGSLVGGIRFGGQVVPYRTFVAPGLLATAAMNGAAFDTTFGFFIRLKYQKAYDAVLATPLEPRDVATGEVVWAVIKGAAFSLAFLVTMAVLGLCRSWWALLALPATVLLGAACGALGLAGATYLRSWTDFDKINLALTPQFLLAATFFPLSRYPGWLRAVVQVTPLYQGVALCRALCLGHLTWGLLVNAAALVAMAAAGVTVAGRRIDTLLRS